MNKLKIITIILLLQTCSPEIKKTGKENLYVSIHGNYYKNKGKIVYRKTGRSGWLYQNTHVIEGRVSAVDEETFEVLPLRKGFSDYYARDKNRVYYAGKEIFGAHPASFKALKTYYAVDKNFAYFRSEKFKVDTASFQGLDEGHYSGVNGCTYTIDKNSVYYKTGKIPYSHGPSFRFIYSAYQSCLLTADKNNVYSYGEKIKRLDGSSIKLLNSRYAKDNYYVLFRKKIIKGADAKTFVVFGRKSEYGKDKNNVYYRGNIVKEADAETFTYIEEKRTYRDKNNIFNHSGKMKK